MIAENPLIIFGKCFISFVLFSTFIGSVLFFFRFVVKGAWGYLIAASLYCMERLIDSMIDINAKWIEMYKISPFSVYKNFTNYRNISFGYAVVFFCVLIIIMYLLCCKEIKRIDLSKEDFHD